MPAPRFKLEQFLGDTLVQTLYVPSNIWHMTYARKAAADRPWSRDLAARYSRRSRNCLIIFLERGTHECIGVLVFNYEYQQDYNRHKNLELDATGRSIISRLLSCECSGNYRPGLDERMVANMRKFFEAGRITTPCIRTVYGCIKLPLLNFSREDVRSLAYSFAHPCPIEFYEACTSRAGKMIVAVVTLQGIVNTS